MKYSSWSRKASVEMDKRKGTSGKLWSIIWGLLKLSIYIGMEMTTYDIVKSFKTASSGLSG